MNYAETLEYIHSIPKFVRPLGNKDLQGVLEKFQNPQDELKFIHIAGTNGKGSTASMLSEVLIEAGFKTGLFTSPFIEVFNERIRINGNNIENDDLCDVSDRVRSVICENDFKLSEFAFISAVAFVYFKEQGCDIVVLETGMGGQLDATNIIENPVVSVITSIGYDHMQYLGDTSEEIAKEKCGIIKKNRPVVSQKNEEVRVVIEEAADKMHSSLCFVDISKKTETGFLYKGKEYPLSLKGDYQAQNGATVVETVLVLRENSFKISDENLENGLLKAKWPARFEFVRDNVVIDGGHNSDGIRALLKSLEDYKFGVVIAMMCDKSTDECMKMIADRAEFVITTQIPMPRCEMAKKLAQGIEDAVIIPEFGEAIDEGIKKIGKDEILCVCGSLYFAAEARKYIAKTPNI